MRLNQFLTVNKIRTTSIWVSIYVNVALRTGCQRPRTVRYGGPLIARNSVSPLQTINIHLFIKHSYLIINQHIIPIPLHSSYNQTKYNNQTVCFSELNFIYVSFVDHIRRVYSNLLVVVAGFSLFS